MNTSNIFLEFPIIKTKRLTLRQVGPADLPDLYQLFNAEETQKYQMQHHYSMEELMLYIDGLAKSFRNQSQIVWAIERNTDKRFLGLRVLYNDVDSELMEIQGYTKEAYIGIILFLQKK